MRKYFQPNKKKKKKITQHRQAHCKIKERDRYNKSRNENLCFFSSSSFRSFSFGRRGNIFLRRFIIDWCQGRSSCRRSFFFSSSSIIQNYSFPIEKNQLNRIIRGLLADQSMYEREMYLFWKANNKEWRVWVGENYESKRSRPIDKNTPECEREEGDGQKMIESNSSSRPRNARVIVAEGRLGWLVCSKRRGDLWRFAYSSDLIRIE